MEKQRKVVLYGSSLALLGIEASLKASSGLEVLRLDGRTTNALEYLEPLCADVIAFDLTAGQPEFAVPLLQKNPHLMLIGLDMASDKVLVLSSEHCKL